MHIVLKLMYLLVHFAAVVGHSQPKPSSKNIPCLVYDWGSKAQQRNTMLSEWMPDQP